jgi:hypothetical protein
VKAIRLNTPAADNGGARRDAGDKLTVGGDAGEIALTRAAALIAAGSATDCSPKAKADK